MARICSRLFAALTLVCVAVSMHGQQSSCKLIINEICVANIDRSIDPSYNYGAWVELYNPTETSVLLNTIKIRHTDSEGKVSQHTLTSSHGTVVAGWFKPLWFDHHTSQGYYGSYASNQIPFKLDADGGLIELVDNYGLIIDAVEYPKCIARCSWMRETDGADAFGWTSNPTPGKTNNESTIATERLRAPVVSSEGGVFKDAYSFTVTIPDSTVTLYYTTDGSAPQPGVSPVSVDGQFSGTETAIYRFLLASEGYLDSPVVTRSFLPDKGSFTLPILSVNSAPKHFFDNTIGLYVKGTNGRVGNNSKVKANQNMDWERPVNVEYFALDADSEYCVAINQEASFNIFGGWSRFNTGNEYFEHRTSFKLKSDKVFEGTKSFDYPLFDSKPHIKIKNILVRNGGQDRDARMLDAAIQELVRTSGVYIDCQAWQPSHVFLDGKYLGMMNLREESNKQFALSNYGIDKDEIEAWENDVVMSEGDKQKMNEWLELSIMIASNPNDTAVWNSICDIVDIDEYCNYMAAEIYMGNTDWLRGGLKNVKGFRAKDDNGRFHLVMHDVDGGFGVTDMMQQIMSKGTGSLPQRFKNMLKYEPFKKQFVDAYCIMDGSVFDPMRSEPIITAIRNTVNPALKLEGLSADSIAQMLIDRLGDYEVRKPALKQCLKSALNLKDEYTVSVKSNVSGASIILNGQEIPTGRFNGYLFAPIVLTTTAPDGCELKEWTVNGEPITSDTLFLSEENPRGEYEIEAVYVASMTASAPIRINEISAGNDIYIDEYGNKGDWMELYNNTDKDFDLAGVYLSDNSDKIHKYQIPASGVVCTVIPAHGYRIVWCDGKESLTQLHAPFKLKNADDAFVSVTAANDEWTDSIRYSQHPRWHTFGRYPDGGNSLALLERPTIEGANHLCTTTILEQAPESIANMESQIASRETNQVESVRYYDIRGQQISTFGTERVVIQQVIFKDGTVRTRKVICPQTTSWRTPHD